VPSVTSATSRYVTITTLKLMRMPNGMLRLGFRISSASSAITSNPTRRRSRDMSSGSSAANPAIGAPIPPLDEWLRDASIPGIECVDTRALTKRIRKAMAGV
jgi:hypothetical protein